MNQVPKGVIVVKKIFMYLSALMLGVLLLCSCGGNTDTDTETSTESDTATEVIDSSTDNATDTETEIDSSAATETKTEVESETSTETEIVSDTDTETNTESDTATDVTDSSTDTETDAETEVDTSTETDTDTEVDTSTEAEQNIVKKYYREIESSYRNYPEEDIVDDGIDEGIGLTKDYLKDPIFLDSGFEMNQESQYKIIDSFDELQSFTLLNHDEIDPNIFENNYVVVILHHFMGPSMGGDYTMGFYNGNFESNGEATITYDEYSDLHKCATEDYRDVYRLHFIAVPKNEIEYTDEICKISLNKNTIEQYQLEAYRVDADTEETKAYWFLSYEEAKNELEFFVGRIDFDSPFIVIHLSEGIETDYIVNGFKYENGEIFITIEIYNKNESFYLDDQYEFAANLILVSLRPNRAELEITVPDDIHSDCNVNVIFKYVEAIN